MVGPTTPDPADVLSVSALNRLAKTSLEMAFPSVWVSGEITKVTRAASGHAYLTLKDETAAIGTTIWKSALARIRFDFKLGMEVLARGKLSIYEARGEYQLNVDQLLPKGIGALDLAFQQLKEKLEGKGYFDPRRKKPLPRFPRSIAIVTSPSGAAIRDMLEILTRRWPIAQVLVVPVRVQGEGASTEIAAAIRQLNQLHLAGSIRIDTMIVGRGGGSIEDLWAFNEEIVADAIFASRIPIISAVGHEIDVTISDLVADHRALTPSHAITDLTPDRNELNSALGELGNRLLERFTRRIDLARQRLNSLAERRAFRSPLDRIRDGERRLDDWDARLQRAGANRVDKGKLQLAALSSRLESLSPLGVLSRGYSLTQSAAGQVIRNTVQVSPGELITTRLADGTITSRVEQTE